MQIKPKTRGFYAFTVERAGDFLLYTESDDYKHTFVCFPVLDLFYLTYNDFHQAIEKNVLSFVEQLPEEIFNETMNYIEVSTNLKNNIHPI